MNYKYTLGVENKKVKDRMTTEQFKLSEILMDKRFLYSLSVKEMADIIGITDIEYVDLEYGEPTVSIENYTYALNKINAYINKK